MARVQGIIASGLQSFSTADAAATPIHPRAVEVEVPNVLEKIRARQELIEDRTTAGAQKELGVQSGLAALGAGAVFGPAGLLVGGLVQLFGRQRIKRAEALASQDAASTEEMLAHGRSQLDTALEAASTDAERAEVEMHIAAFDQLEAASLHPDPNIRSAALAKILDISGTLDAELEEVQARELEARKLEREQFEFEVGQANEVESDITAEVGKDWNTRLDAYRSMLAVEDTAFGDQTLIIRAMKINDPNSAVLPGEAATAANLAGMPEIVVTAANHAFRNGERLTERQRADLIRQSGLIVAANRESVLSANERASERLNAAGVRADLRDSVLLKIPNADELPLPRNSERIGRADELALAGPERPDVTPDVEDRLVETDNLVGLESGYADMLTGTVGTAVDYWQRVFASQEREAVGSQLMVDPETGREYERASDGTIRAIETSSQRAKENRGRLGGSVQLTPEAAARAAEIERRAREPGARRGLIERESNAH